jgi:hypothetical protein
MAKISEGVGVCHRYRNTLIEGRLTWQTVITITVAITASFVVESGKISSRVNAGWDSTSISSCIALVVEKGWVSSSATS